MLWWQMVAKQWSVEDRGRRWDGKMVNEKRCCINADIIPLSEVLDLFQAWKDEGWSTVALWREEQ